MDEKFLSQLLGDIAGIRIALRALATTLAFHSGGGNEEMRQLHELTLKALENEVLFGGGFNLDVETAKERARAILDSTFASSAIK